MSAIPAHVSLQRVVVRMLHDATFAHAVFTKPDEALADVCPEQRSWLLAIDRRAYRTDPDRAARVLVGLLEEFPTSAAHLVRGTRDSLLLDSFFCTERFHRGMQAGESLAILFGLFLQDLAIQGGDPSVIDLACFETAIALVRRERGNEAISLRFPGTNSPLGAVAAAFATSGSAAHAVTELATRSQTPPAELLRLSPTCALLEVGTPVLDHFNATREALSIGGADSRAAIFDFDLPWPRFFGHRESFFLLTGVLGDEPCTGGARSVVDVHVEEISPELARLLGAARTGASREALLQLLRAHGASPAEGDEVLADLIADSLIVQT